MDWNILSKYHFNYTKTNILLFRRTKLMQYKYDLYTQNTSDIYTDIYNKYFYNNNLFILAKNNYPYNLSTNIVHYILWFNPLIYRNKLHILLNKKYITTILNRYIKSNEYICFMNVPDNQSIKNIYHYQVFIKKNNILK